MHTARNHLPGNLGAQPAAGTGADAAKTRESLCTPHSHCICAVVSDLGWKVHRRKHWLSQEYSHHEGTGRDTRGLSSSPLLQGPWWDARSPAGTTLAWRDAPTRGHWHTPALCRDLGNMDPVPFTSPRAQDTSAGDIWELPWRAAPSSSRWPDTGQAGRPVMLEAPCRRVCSISLPLSVPQGTPRWVPMGDNTNWP